MEDRKNTWADGNPFVTFDGYPALSIGMISDMFFSRLSVQLMLLHKENIEIVDVFIKIRFFTGTPSRDYCRTVDGRYAFTSSTQKGSTTIYDATVYIYCKFQLACSSY